MIELDGSSLTIEQLIAIADRDEPVTLSPQSRERVRASGAVVDRRARGEEPAYGINTGFGSFADVKIAPDALEALQLNLLRSHAAGVGEPLPGRAVRATMALRANALAKGFSGISVETLEALMALVNGGVHPPVPSRGSVGASGDLAPRARRPEADHARSEGRPRADQRHAAVDRGRGARARRRRAARARRRHRRRALDRCAARIDSSVRGADSRRPAVRRPAHLRRQHR